MCGIVGYDGNKKTVDILLEGLTSLEYRGYDSSGIALNIDNKVELFKAAGKLQNLKDIVDRNYSEISKSTIGIGHIRWATHGAPTVANAHPHSCNCGRVAVVHNGIIENYKELREKLEKNGCTFRSQTDTETVAHLVASKFAQTQDLTEAVRLATPPIIKDSIKITLAALHQYRMARKMGSVPNMNYDREVQTRYEVLLRESLTAIKLLEENIPNLYTPEGFEKVFKEGFLAVPYLMDMDHKFPKATMWKTAMKNGGVFVVDEDGKVISTEKRYSYIIDHMKR